MHHPASYTFESPLEGYRNASRLSSDKNNDQSLKNPPSLKPSSAYKEFTAPLDNGRQGGFDVHVYWDESIPEEAQYATELHSRIRYEFPELRIYRMHRRPIGPHPKPMFEVNLLSPTEFGAFIPWLAIHRGPLSALLHPNTTPSTPESELRDHTQRACWLGTSVTLVTSIFEEAE